MKPLHHPLLAAIAALALSPATAPAAPSFFDHPKGSLSAPTDLHASSGCVDTDTFLWPQQNPDGTRAVFAELTQYDHCADQVLLDHVGNTELTSSQLQIVADLTSASLTATIPMNDALDEAFPPADPVALDLTWTGTGRVHRANILYENGHHDGITVINHDHEACRDATVSGAGAVTVAEAGLCRQIAGSLFLFIE